MNKDHLDDSLEDFLAFMRGRTLTNSSTFHLLGIDPTNKQDMDMMCERWELMWYRHNCNNHEHSIVRTDNGRC